MICFTQAFFQQTNAEGVSMHGHITELIQTLLRSKDENALAEFENISLDIKKKRFVAAEPGEKNAVAPLDASDSWITRSNKLLHQVDTSEEDEGLPNLFDEACMFEWAGVGLSQAELYRLFLAMMQLKAKHALKSVRFFGKILGTSSDYFVIEGVLSELPPAAAEDASAVPAEPSGAGLNACVYFVSGDVSAEWTQLPDVQPAHVVAACAVRKYCTGNLDAPMRCYPPFPGKEREYLRAQIARIAAATVLVPLGKFKLDDEVEEGPQPVILTPADEYKESIIGAKEMESAENWCHLSGGILKIGRCTNPPKPEREDDDEEAEEEAVEEEEVAALTAASADPPVSELMPEMELPAWTFKLYHKEVGDACVAIAKSNRWPGAYSAAVQSADSFANLYIGYGCENTGSAFTPLPPPAIMAEAPDVEEQLEVTLDQENEVLKRQADERTAKENEDEEEEDD